jgi:hypothetical protein
MEKDIWWHNYFCAPWMKRVIREESKQRLLKNNNPTTDNKWEMA